MPDYGGPDIRGRALSGQAPARTALDDWIERLEAGQPSQAPSQDPLTGFDAWIARLEAEQRQPRPAPPRQPSVQRTSTLQDVAAADKARTSQTRAHDVAGQWAEARQRELDASYERDPPRAKEPTPVNVEAMAAINAIRKPAFEKADAAKWYHEPIPDAAEQGLPLDMTPAQLEAGRAGGSGPPARPYKKVDPVIPTRHKEEEEPGAWARFTQSTREVTVGNLTKAFAVEPRLREAVEVEARFRIERGLYDPEEADGQQLRRVIDRELELGLPMYSELATKIQREAYMWMAELGPQQFPHAKGFWNKVAQFSGDMGPLLAELAVLKRVGLSKLARTVAKPLHPALAGSLEMGPGFAASDALHGGDPGKGFVTGATLGLVGAGGRAAAGAPGAAGAVGTYFAGKTAAEGGDAWDIAIAGILAPIAFHGKELAPSVVRGLRNAPAAADKVLGKAVETIQAGRDATADVRLLVKGLADGTLSLSKDGRKVWRELQKPAPEQQRLAMEAAERTQPQREPSVFIPEVEARGEAAMRELGATTVPIKGPIIPPKPTIPPKEPTIPPKELPGATEGRAGEKVGKQQPWEMTWGRFLNQNLGEIDTPTTRGAISIRHTKAVEQALREGKPVPPEVLKDYPDLQPKPAEPPQVPTELEQLKARKFKTRGDELKIKRLEAEAKLRPGQWNPGDGAGFRVAGQITRGYRIVSVDEAAKTADLKMVADTGLADANVGDRITVSLVDLVRERKYDSQPTKPAEPPQVPAEQKVKEQNFEQFLQERKIKDPGAEHGALSPSGRMSKQARAALDKRRDKEFAAFAKAQDEYRSLVNSGKIVDPTGRVQPAESTEAAEAFDRKHKLIEATGFIPPRSAEAMGAVASSAETEVLYSVGGKIVNYVRGSPEQVKERELASRISRQRRGRIGLASVDVQDMGKEMTRIEKGLTSPEELYNIHQAMVGKHSIDDLPEAQARWVRKARALHDKASLDLLVELLKVEGETALTESIRQNIGTYLEETLTPKGPIEQARALVSRKTKLRSEQFKFKRDQWTVQVGRAHFKFETKAEAKTAYDALLRNELTAVIRKKALERGVTPSDLKKAAAAKKVKLLAPLTEEQHIEIGHSRNPMFTWATSYTTTRHNAETLRSFRHLNRQFGQEPPADVAIEGEKAIAEWAKENGLERVTGDKEAVGVLADRYLPKRMAKDVNELMTAPGWFMRWYAPFLQAWKASKTIWNIPTHFRNVFGNVPFTDFAGNAVWNPANWKYYNAAARDILVRGSDYRALVREGVIGGEYYGNEIKQILVRMDKGDAPDLALLKMGKLAHEKLGRLYNAEDQLFKLATYLKYRSQGMAPKTAAREVNRWFPNYAELSRAGRIASKSPIGGPFLAFNEQAIRIASRAAIRHPLKLAKWAAMPGAMTAFSTYYLGLSEDERDLIDSRRSYFEPILPWRDAKGAVQTLDLRYIVPMGNELQKVFDIGTPKGGGRIEVPFLFQNPPVSGWLDISFNKKMFTGQQVVNPDDDLKTKIVKWTKHTLRESTPVPTSFTWGKERLQRAFAGEGNEHVIGAIAGVLFGVNIRTPYVSRQEAYDRIRALAEKDPAVRRVMDRLLDGKMKSMSYGQLSRSLSRSERFQDLLDMYNEVYRKAGGKEIKPKGVLQSIRRRTGEEAKKRKSGPISMAKPRIYNPLPANLSFNDLARTA